MRIYLLENAIRPFDGSVEAALSALGETYHRLELPESHEGVSGLIREREGGVIFIPPAWEDLFCVKVVDEIQALMMPFETVIAGPLPSVANLVVAFNNGLTCVLETPAQPDRLRQVLTRAAARYAEKVKFARLVLLLQQYEAVSSVNQLSPQALTRDHLLGEAITHLLQGSGPVAEGKLHVLLVSSSPSQQKQMETLLRQINLKTAKAASIAEAVKVAKDRVFSMVISDGVLPDGDAPKLAAALRSALTANIPRVVVWSSSPDKAPDLLSPENHIDAVIVKPGPNIGMESVLPTVLAELYRGLP